MNDWDEKEDSLNLIELLTTNNSITRFLDKYKIHFSYNSGKLEIFQDNKHVPLNDTHNHEVCYLKWRLGHTSRIDHCINGFMLKDRIYKNSYTRSLWFGPEFIQTLSKYLRNDDIVTEYRENSTYYCFEYNIPKAMIIFDDKEDLDDSEKTNFFMKRILHRLYDYYNSDPCYLFDHGNSILRLADDCNLSNQIFLKKQIISRNIIK